MRPDADGLHSSRFDCTLCEELKSGTATLWRHSVEDDTIAATPSLGPLAEGHLLVCPLRHVRSWMELDTDRLGYFLTVIEAFADRLSRAVNRPVHMFEHGNAAGGTRIVCSVEHAHLHLLPAAVDVWQDLQQERIWIPVGNQARAMKALADGREYLLYRPPGRGFVMSPRVDESIPSQLMRRHFAAALGIAERWNWRDWPETGRVAHTALLLGDALEDPAPLPA